MKYVLIVGLIGLDSCGFRLESYHTMEVETQEQCLDLAEEYINLPFVKSTECSVKRH